MTSTSAILPSVNSYQYDCYVDVYVKYPDLETPEWVTLKPISGSVTVDRDAESRRTFTAEFAEYPDIIGRRGQRLRLDQVIPDPYAVFMRPFIRYTSGPYSENEPLGLFKIYTIDDILPAAGVNVSGFDLAKTIQEYKFIFPFTREKGQSTHGLIRELVNSAFTVSDYDWDSYPGGTVPSIIFEVPDKPTVSLTYEEEDRWALISRLAASLKGVPYFDRFGRFVVGPLVPDTGVYTQLLASTMEVSRTVTRDNMWNGIVVTGEAVAKKGKKPKASPGSTSKPTRQVVKGEVKRAAIRKGNDKDATSKPVSNMSNAKAFKFYDGGGNHFAMDIGVPKGTPIFAVRSGVVKFVRDSEPDCFTCPSGTPANTVIIESEFQGRKCVISYNHNTARSARVKAGDRVTAGQTIARVGSSGHSTGYHLHIGASWGQYDGPGDQWKHQNHPDSAIFPPQQLWRKSGASAAAEAAQMTMAALTSGDEVSGTLSGASTSGARNNGFVPPKNAKAIWTFLIKQNITQKGAAAVLGNFHWESNLNPAAVEGNGIGHGLAQWSFGRADALMAFARKKGKPWSNLDLQLDFFMHELETSYRSTYRMLKNADNVADAAYDFHRLFEKSADSEAAIRNNRVATARDYYREFKFNISGTLDNAATSPPIKPDNSADTSYDEEDTSDPDVLIRGWAVSRRVPTAWDGPFGRVPVFVNNSDLHTPEACEELATALLERAPDLGIEYSLTTLPDPTIEPGYYVKFLSPPSSYELTAMVMNITISLSGDEPMAIQANIRDAVDVEELMNEITGGSSDD